MPGFDPDSPFNRECKLLHAQKVYWIHPSTLEDINAMPSNIDEPRSTMANEITRNGQARLMVCLADFLDETGAPGASLWLPLQSKGDAEIAEAEKCGYDHGPKKWRNHSSQYWLKGVTWLLGRSGNPFDPQGLTGQRYISAFGLQEVRGNIRTISITKSWLEALDDDYISGKVIFPRGKRIISIFVARRSLRVSRKAHYEKQSSRFRAPVVRLPRTRSRPVPRPPAE